MKSVDRFMCLILSAMILLVPLAAAADEMQNGSEVCTDDSAAASGGQESDGRADGGSSGSGGGGASRRYMVYSITQAVGYFNVQDYTIEDSEKKDMHGFETAMRRDRETGDAWVVFEIPYMSEFHAKSLHFPSDVAPMKFEFSKDGKSWTKAEPNVNETPEDGRWTAIDYSLSGISGVRYIKVVWGDEKNLQQWWNPYFIRLTAKVGTPYDCEIVIDTDDNISIPMYDAREYRLSGRVLDQIGLERGSEILWSNAAQDSKAVTIGSDGTFIVSADMEPGTKFTAKACCGRLSETKTFTLCAALPGDTDGDNIITQVDIDFILENYGRTADMQNRLCDADKNGIIDIIDLSYAARYLNVDFNKKADEPTEKGDESDDGGDTDDNTNESDSAAKKDDGDSVNRGVGGSDGEISERVSI